MPQNQSLRVSIITVCYNSAGTIVDTLKSVADQSYANIEHIIVDGASKDNTVALVRQHGSHVAQLISEQDHGIYDAMNKGIRLATGDVVGFLNADDMFAAPDRIAKFAELAQQNDVMYADLDYIEQRDESRIVRHWESGGFKRKRLRYGWMPPHPTFYIKRSLMQSIGEFDTSLRIAADYEYMIRCLTRSDVKIGYLPEVLVKMRIGGVSNRSLASIMKKSNEDLRVMKRHGIGGITTLAAKNLRKLGQFIT